MVADTPGGTIDFGVINLTDDWWAAYGHIHNVWTRSARWFEEHGHPINPTGLTIYTYDTFVVPYPANTRPTGLRASTDSRTGIVYVESHLKYEDRWDEFRIAQLFAEVWQVRNGNYLWGALTGCNGVCDDQNFVSDLYGSPGCGYCDWCPEDLAVAWDRGFTMWAASQIVGEFETRYGDRPFDSPSYEYTRDCTETTQTQWETPGLFAALLTDISDSHNEHSVLTPEYWDALSMGPEPILDLFDNTTMNDPYDFFDEIRAAYPELCTEITLTAQQNGYGIDGAPPATVSDLHSTSHTIGVASTDATVDLDWTAPPDDCETAWKYSLVIGPGPTLPDTDAEVRGVTYWTTPELPPGSYYISIRSADASNNWDSGYDSVGPIIIGEPTPANLTHVYQSGWGAWVTPRADATAAPGNVPVPTAVLPGNTQGTYWNASVGNVGGAAVGASTGLWVQADGIGFYNPFDPVEHAAAIPNLAGGAKYEALNLGPLTVRGGRHTFGAYNDFTGLAAESDETDNYWGRQWIWSPYVLPEGGSTSRAAPPARTGGWDGSVSNTWFNCDGLNFHADGPGWWNAVSIVANARDVDYDARLHVAASGAESGFASGVGYSGRPVDCVDAVIANRNQVGNASWDVGVVQASDETSLATYEARHVSSTLETFGVQRTFTMTQYEYMSLHEVQIDSGNVGPVSFVVRCLTSTDAPFHIAWLDQSFTTGGLDDYTEAAGSDETGVSRLDVNVPTAGYHCLVVYRDPRDGAIESEDYLIEIDTTPPDLVPLQPTGWGGSIVARNAADATAGSAPDPVSLTGWTNSTYLNLALENAGPTLATPSFEVDMQLDGSFLTGLMAFELPAGDPAAAENLGPYELRGGRHTISMYIDVLDDIEEISELNNNTSRQWAWTPQTLSFGVNTGIPMPGDPYGGWPYLDWSDPTVIWPNADGYRTPAFGPADKWGAVAVMPGASSDVTLRLHTAVYDVNASFGVPIAFSGFSLGETEFCLLELPLQNGSQFDVGLSSAGGSEDNVIEVVKSTYLANDPSGTYGTFQLGANEMLNLHEVDLNTPALWLRLKNLSATADLGVSIYKSGESAGAQGRIDAIPDGTAYIAPPGADENVVCAIPTPGNYCIAVYKRDAGSLADTADYELVFDSVTDAPPSVATTRTQLVSIVPNPFNPQTQITFDLKQSARVSLGIYDLRGRLVRQLASVDYSAGRHQLSWNGLDDSGLHVASGVYLVRFAANGAEEQRKITLVK